MKSTSKSKSKLNMVPNNQMKIRKDEVYESLLGTWQITCPTLPFEGFNDIELIEYMAKGLSGKRFDFGLSSFQDIYVFIHRSLQMLFLFGYFIK